MSRVHMCQKGAKARNASSQVHIHFFCCCLLAVTSKTLCSKNRIISEMKKIQHLISSHYEPLFLES